VYLSVGTLLVLDTADGLVSLVAVATALYVDRRATASPSG
jgi:hypothetical protein